jgi:hypothetical protein
MRTGDRLGEITGGRVGPADVEALGEDDDAAAEVGGAADRGDGAVEVGGGFAALDQRLSHGEAEGLSRHEARLVSQAPGRPSMGLYPSLIDQPRPQADRSTSF